MLSEYHQLIPLQKIIDILSMAYNENYFMVTCNGFDPEDDKYNAGLLNIHSDTLIDRNDMYKEFRRLRTNKKLSWVEWGPFEYIKKTFQKNAIQ